jgi:antitoxin ParD1/3/4
MPIRSVDLTEHFDSLIADGVASGRYGDASEAVQAGLTLLEQQEKRDQAKLEQLRDAIREGVDEIDRGEGIRFASIDDLADYVHAIGEEVSGEIAAERALG